MQSFWYRHYLSIWTLAVAISLLLRAGSFWGPHNENDERVYLYLSQHMGWDTTRYSTEDNAEFRKFPWSIYRQPLFHQPPMLPLVLKTGGLILGNPIQAGILFNNASVCILLFGVWRWMVRLRVPPAWGAVAFAGVTFCPLLLSSTSMLHNDGLLGIYLACGLIAFVEVLEEPTVGKAFLAGALLTIALNLRYNALIALPLLPVFVWYQRSRNRQSNHSDQANAERSRPIHPQQRWVALAIVFGLVATLGMQHYYRILAAYGTLNPESFVQLDTDAAQFNDYVRMIVQQQRWKMLVFLALIFPVFLVFLLPSTWRAVKDGLRDRSWGPIALLAFVYLFSVQLAISYNQIRFFAAVMPWLYLGMPFLGMAVTGWQRWAIVGISVLALLMMITTGFAKTQTRPPATVDVIPSLIYYLPPLRSFYP